MVAAVHVLEPGTRAGDAEILRHRVREWTMAAESVLHDLGVIHMLSSDSQGMGRIGEVVRRAFQCADAMKAQAGAEPGPADNERVLRYLAKVTINPAITHGLAADVGSLEVGKLADLALWAPELFAVRPELILKAGMPAWGSSGDGDGSTMMVEPVTVRPQFAASGSAPAQTSLAFLAGASMEAELPTRRRRARVHGCRDLTAADMVRNTRTGTVTVDADHARGAPGRRAAAGAAGGAAGLLRLLPAGLNGPPGVRFRMAVTESLPILHLSLITGGVLRDGAGGQLGRVDDVVVRLGADYPVVGGVLATVAGRRVFVPAEVVREIGHGYVELSEVKLDLRPFERRTRRRCCSSKIVLDRQLINVEGARLVRTNEMMLARVDGWYRVVGVDTGLRGLTRRVLPRRLAPRVQLGQFLDWASVEPFTGHVPTVRLRVPHPKLARLHPAQLADLVEAASHREGEEIMSALADEELEADVFEELDPQHQREFIVERTDAEVAGVLARMEFDDAVDMLGELDEERRRRILELLPPLQARRVRALAGYDPATAGGLMSPDFICLYATATKREAVERIKRDHVKANSVTSIFTMNLHRRLQGEIRLVDLIRAEDDAVLADLATVKPRVVTPDTEVEEIARLMTDYDLTIVAVTGAKGELMGVVTVDDVLELVLPRGWRRKFDLFGGESRYAQPMTATQIPVPVDGGPSIRRQGASRPADRRRRPPAPAPLA